MGCEMVALLCGSNGVRQAEARTAAVRALQSRIEFWNGIAESIVLCPEPRN